MRKHQLRIGLAVLTAISFWIGPVHSQRAPDGAAHDPGLIGETLCKITCIWEGYEFRVHRPGGMAGTNARILELVKIDSIFFARPQFIQSHFGTTSPDPSVARIELYKESASINDGICDRFGNPIKGKVYRIHKNNQLNFESGQTPILDDSAMCQRGLVGTAGLRQLYNATVKPVEPIPPCSMESQGCRKPPKVSDDIHKGPPRGPTPAEFEKPEDVPSDYFDCSPWDKNTWDNDCPPSTQKRPWATEWLNRDSPGGKGDYETLSAFKEAGKACPNPIDIQCQTVAGVDWQESGQVYICDPSKGGICQNAKQKSGRCLDYKVRFLCESKP